MLVTSSFYTLPLGLLRLQFGPLPSPQAVMGMQARPVIQDPKAASVQRRAGKEQGRAR